MVWTCYIRQTLEQTTSFYYFRLTDIFKKMLTVENAGESPELNALFKGRGGSSFVLRNIEINFKNKFL